MSDKIFISCVSSQFKACREALASDLRAIGCEVKVQDDFSAGTRYPYGAERGLCRSMLALVKELDGLALALEQAGSFIAQKRLAIAEYLDRWRQRETKVREWFDERLMHYPRSVAVTWDTSAQQLDAAAFGLLQILCWFAPEPVPRALLNIASAKQELANVLALTGFNPSQKANPTSKRPFRCWRVIRGSGGKRRTPLLACIV